MSNFALAYYVDLVGYAVAALVLTWAVDRRIRRRGREYGMGRRAWRLMLALLACGLAMSFAAGERERGQLKRTLEGFAPTYAVELSQHGHSRITPQTPPDDPVYLKLIETQKRWLAVNPAVNDIYTFRRLQDGRFAFIVDSETDYDRNGRYEGDREQRTAIGEVYERVDESFGEAMDGRMGFDGVPYHDRWGVWVSATYPMYGPDGKVEAGLGVDFDAAVWVRSILVRRAGVMGFFAVALTILVWSGWLISLSRERERLQRQLVEVSRQAGMAEVATGVLHNVGNVLNTVNVSAHLLADRLRQWRVSGVERAAKLLQENRERVVEFLCSDERGRLFPEYLEKLGAVLRADQEELLGTVRGLGEGIEHINAIIRAQQDLATGVCVKEPLRPAALFNEAINLNLASCNRHGVQVVREMQDVSLALLDRHKVLQVLVNLISNAKDATVESQRKDKRIQLGLSHGNLDDGRKSVRFSVSDNGVGMSSQIMAKIFAFGFTTRKDGHGIGLPTAASMASEMGGRLTARSQGPGLGATFVLELPLVCGEVKT